MQHRYYCSILRAESDLGVTLLFYVAEFHKTIQLKNMYYLVFVLLFWCAWLFRISEIARKFEALLFNCGQYLCAFYCALITDSQRSPARLCDSHEKHSVSMM